MAHAHNGNQLDTSTAVTPRRRRPWVAAILSFLVPGLGHQYIGRYLRAVLLFLFFRAADLMALILMALIPVKVANIVVPFTLILALRALLASIAARDARRMAADAPVGPLSRWYSLVAACVLVGVVIQPVSLYVCKTTLVQTYSIPTGSMEKTILRGDRLLAVKWAYGWRIPPLQGIVFGRREARRRDLVVFPFPEDPERAFLLRVIGLPGETVEIQDRTVFVNGRPLEEPYAHFLSEASRDNWGPQVVPDGHVLVLGDNRDNSRDSRFWGFVREDDLLGCARAVYWSAEPDTGRVRWERIGHRLE